MTDKPSEQIPTEAAPLEGEVVNRKNPNQAQVNRTLDAIEGETEKRNITVIETMTNEILADLTIVRFGGRVLLLIDQPYPHYVPLSKPMFDEIAYQYTGGVPKSKIGDIFAYICATCPELTDYRHYILFGMDLPTAILHPELTDYDSFFASENKQQIWDMKELSWLIGEDLEKAVWRSPYPRVKPKDVEPKRLPFIMELAGGDEGLYDDIMQSIAPIFMDKKPDGVVWWVGAGANGKSTLMDALYRIFPGQLASINVKRLTDGRDTPSLNGRLANVVKESSEGRVDDTEIYKALGTHENFRVHKFHSQEDIEIEANIHTIFNANSIPTFNDKGYSARRRTFIIPFLERFESDPLFEQKTFTAEFFGSLINEIAHYAQQLKKQGYRYKWSAKTRNAKIEYDKEANNAEEYAAGIINEGVVAFDSFQPVRIDYENWCAEQGYPPLGIGNLRKALNNMGFERSSARTESGVNHVYKLPDVGTTAIQAFGMGRMGLYTTEGFTKHEPVEPEVPEFTEPGAEPKKKDTPLKGKW